MRCIFFIEDYPITPDSAGGAPALSYSHLEMLAHTGAEIHLVMLSNPRRPLGFHDYTLSQQSVWERVKSWCASHRMIEIEHARTEREPLKNFARALLDPVPYICADAQPAVLDAFKSAVAELKPDLIWAEHRVPAMLAKRAATGVPVIYSHHDWEWRLGLLRHEAKKDKLSGTQNLRSRFGVWQTKRAEYATVRGVAGCVSGSITETAEFKTIGARRVAYFPTTSEPVRLPDVDESSLPVRVVHLGGMQGSRNQVSVQRFLDAAWFPFCAGHEAAPELWMVGSMKSAPAEFLAQLEQAKAVCTGFVRDLSAALRPFDIHVVPWELPTGTRTRIPVALNHAQALISTKAAAACLPELKHDENCILVDDLREMGASINALLDDPARRRRIAEAGRETFLQHFTREAIQPRFQQFIAEISAADATGAQNSLRLPASRLSQG